MQRNSPTDGVEDEDRLEVRLQPAIELKNCTRTATTSIETLDTCNSTTDESEDQTSQWHCRGSDNSPKKSSPRRITRIGQATKAKAKRALHVASKEVASKESKRNVFRKDIDVEANGHDHNEDDVLNGVTQNPAFNPKQLMRKDGFSLSGTIDATFGTTKGTLYAISHPKRAIKAKTARKLATPEHPYLSPEADLQLLAAHDEMIKIQSSRTATSDDSSSDLEDERERVEKKIDNLESERAKARVAWITSRHIFRVRVVPKQQFAFPVRSDYYERNDNGTNGKFRYERYIGAMMLYYSQDFASQYIDDFNTLPFNKDTLVRHLERLVMVSGPWQSWLINVRSIYRWEHPKKTATWLGIILTMWYCNHMMTFLYCYLIFVTVKRRFRAETVEDIRISYERALSRGAEAYRISELISKHGSDKWLDPLLDEIGPIIQLQIGDLADLLEIYQNCYDWNDPWMTTCTLLFLVSCILVGHFASVEFSLKILEWVGILYFFFSRPISSLYPRYRHAVSPVKWTIWGIPTHAEWAFRQLRSEAQNTRAAIIGHRVTEKYLAEEINPTVVDYGGNLELSTETQTTVTDDKTDTGYDSEDSSASYETACSSASALGDKELFHFRCRWRSCVGRLILLSSGLKFKSSFPTRRTQWSRSYLDLVEIRKQSPESRIQQLATMEVVQFLWTDGTIDEVLETRGRRDEIFNCVLGFSGLKWQALQPLADDLKTKRKREQEQEQERNRNDNVVS